MFILHKAIRDGQIQFVEYLMKSGSQIEEKDNFQMTPLHCAAQFGHIEIVKVLLEKGAQMEAKNKEGNTPLHEAADNCHLEVVKFLIEWGAQIEPKNESGQTPLTLAINHIEIAKYLLEKGALLKKDKNQWDSALRKGYFLDVVKSLVKHGVDINSKNDGCGPITLTGEIHDLTPPGASSAF